MFWMDTLSDLVRRYDALPSDSNQAKSLLVKIEAWDGPIEDFMEALHITSNGSLAAAPLKKKLDGFDPHRNYVIGTNQ